MAKHTEPIKLQGKFSGLAMKPTGDAGTDEVGFKISTKDRNLWDDLKAFIDQDVEITLLGKQGDLFKKGGKDAPGRGVKDGSEAATGAVQAQD